MVLNIIPLLLENFAYPYEIEYAVYKPDQAIAFIYSSLKSTTILYSIGLNNDIR